MTSRAIARIRLFVLVLLAVNCGEGGGTGPNHAPTAAVGGPYSSTTGVVAFDGRASSDPDGDDLTYHWNFGDGTSGSGATPSHTYQATGTYTVQLTVTDERGASSDPAGTSADVQNVGPAVTAGADTSGPVGMPVAIGATFTDDDGAPWRYAIDWGDGTTDDGTRGNAGAITATHTYAAEASYRVRVTVTDRFDVAASDSLRVTATAPVLLLAGDIGDCGPTRWYDDSTGALLARLSGIVVPLGDNAYDSGTLEEYETCYDPAWGHAKDRTRPVAGNHEYYTPGGAGYFAYFGDAAGDPDEGYYSFELGSWFVLVLNTGPSDGGTIPPSSPQVQWLRAELASHAQQCVVALLHHPRFSTTLDRAPIAFGVKALWDTLYAYGADLVINGHDHNYQRFAPQKPDGTADPAFGIRQITVGTGGGEGLYQFADPVPNLEARDRETFGVLELTLRAGRYDWRFVPSAGGKTFTDSGTGTCHGRPT